MTGDGTPPLASRRDGRPVYEPAEDSALLAGAAVDVVESEDVVFEVGVGSGWVAERVATETGARVVGGDVNPHACRAARDRGVETVRADLVDPLADASVDTVLCNPPYLPTDPDTAWGDWMEAALDGGPDGRAVIRPFLGSVGRVLVPGGVALLVASTLTGLDEVRGLAAENGLTATVVDEESYPFERLAVVRLDR